MAYWRLCDSEARPDGEFFLDEFWVEGDLHIFAEGILARHKLAPPQGTDGVDLLVHDFPAHVVALGKEDEVVDVSAGAEGDGDSTGGELVDQGPFLGDEDGIMQRGDEASGAQLQAGGDHGESCRRKASICSDIPGDYKTRQP